MTPWSETGGFASEQYIPTHTDTNNDTNQSELHVQIERRALEKVVDPSEQNYYCHSTTLSALPQILNTGLIPTTLAQRAISRGIDIRVPVQQFYESPEYAVCVIDAKLTKPGIHYVIPTYEVEGSSITSHPNDVTIMIDRAGIRHETRDQFGPYGSFEVPRRICPEYFIGLALHSKVQHEYHGHDITMVDVNDITYQQLLRLAMQYCLPLYDKLGELWWPKRISLDDVKQLMSSIHSEP